MTSCEAVQDRLAELGAAAAQEDEALRGHLEGCADCQAVQAALEELDAGLAGLADQDAPDALVDKTLAAVRTASQAGPLAKSTRSINRPWLAGAMAASLVVLASAALVGELWEESGFKDAELYHQTVPALPAPSPTPSAKPTVRTGEQAHGDQQMTADAELPAPVQSPPPAKEKSDLLVGGKLLPDPAEEAAQIAPNDQTAGSEQRLGAGQGFVDSLANQEYDDDGRTGGLAGEYRVETKAQRREKGASESNAPILEFESEEGGEVAETGGELADQRRQRETAAPQSNSQSEIVSRDELARGDRDSFGLDDGTLDDGILDDGILDDGILDESAPADLEDLRSNEATRALELDGNLTSQSFGRIERQAGQDKKTEAFKDEAEVSLSSTLTRKPEDADAQTDNDLGLVGKADRLSQVVPKNVSENSDLAAAETYLDRLGTLDGIAFRPATGYWSNSYIPGDPAIRLLEARLKDWNRAALGRDLTLEQGARPVAQPFDAPRDAAMALYLQTDAQAVQGPARLRLQIGLKGAERQGARRPAMNVGLVFDLRQGADTETARRLSALVAALEAARQPGDRFSLIVAGPDGGLMVTPEDFRHGPVKVALDRLFLGGAAAAADEVGLVEALSLAGDSLRAGDRPEEILGSSLLLLASGTSLADEMNDLEALAHGNALEGLHLSVVALGGETEAAQIDRLVAAGQGHRRVLSAPDQAATVIDRELHAASRAVARALRLRIRLASGVKLVEVLGAQRLDEPRAQRVREAEQAIDQRLSQNLGIAADRGEDEEGIQIVIPNFFAGDDHVILLDLVTDGPGPVADVTLRYKDLVTLGNGVAQASLALPNGPVSQGPLERNVLKNLVASEIARQARLISLDLRNDDVALAKTRAATLARILQGLRRQVPGWAADPDLAADQAMLDEYLTALRSPGLQDPAQRQWLADSLDFAAHRKLLAAAR